MADKSYKDKVKDELLDIADNEAFSDAERKYAEDLANHLVGKGDEEVKKIIYASFNDPKLYNVTKAMASAFKEEKEIGKVTKATTKAPVYNTKVGEMFAKFGGDEILDERSPKYWEKADNEVDDRVISEIAEEYGMQKQDLYKMLQDESIKERNRQIFSGTDLGSDWSDRLAALVLKFVAPRTMESLEQGKGFVPADVAKDVAENIIYSLNPVARVSNLGFRTLGKYAPKLATERMTRFGTNLASSFGTPAIAEVSEAIVDEATDTERNKNVMEIVKGIFGEGVFNALIDKKLGRKLAKYGANTGLRKEAIGIAEDASEEAAKETKKLYTAKDFIDETEKALKQREKVEKKVQEKGRGIKPSEQAILDSAKGISLGNKDMNDQITEIAKLMAKQDLSLEEATAKHFEKVRKKMKDDKKFFKYLDDFKVEIPSESEPVKKLRMVDGKYVTTIEEQPKKYKYFFSVDDNGIVRPSKDVAESINDSSWGKVLTTKFDKPKRATPVRESFISKSGKNLARLGLNVGKDIYPYAKYKFADFSGSPAADFVTTGFGKFPNDEEEKRKKREEEEAEKKARSRYVFNPYKTEDKPKKASGIRAYLRGEAERPTQEEVKRAIARKLGFDLGE